MVMDVSRRSIMKLFASAPIVGPSIAKEAAKLSILDTGKVALGSSIKSFEHGEEIDLDSVYKAVKKPPLIKQLQNLVKESDFLKKRKIPDFEKQQWIRDYQVRRFDADLAVNKSMSLVAKLNIQRERDWKKHEFEVCDKTQEKYWILNEIQSKKIYKAMKKAGIIDYSDKDINRKSCVSNSRYSYGMDDSNIESSDEEE